WRLVVATPPGKKGSARLLPSWTAQKTKLGRSLALPNAVNGRGFAANMSYTRFCRGSIARTSGATGSAKPIRMLLYRSIKHEVVRGCRILTNEGTHPKSARQRRCVIPPVGRRNGPARAD